MEFKSQRDIDITAKIYSDMATLKRNIERNVECEIDS